MSRAAYDRDALDRIHAGASARDLGWDEPFYRTVCRNHGLVGVEASAMPSVKEAAPLQPEPPSTPQPRKCSALARVSTSIKGAVYYDAINREIYRNGAVVNLRGRDVDVFEALASVPVDMMAKGHMLAGILGLKPSSMASYVAHLRITLRPLALGVKGIVGGGRVAGVENKAGYYLSDFWSEQRIAIEPFVALDKKRSGAS